MKLFTLLTLHTHAPVKNKFLITPEKEGRKAVVLNWATNEKDYVDLPAIVSTRMITSSETYELKDTSSILKFLTNRVRSKLETILTEAQYQDQVQQ